MKLMLALSTMLIFVVTGCAGVQPQLSPIDLPFNRQDPAGFDVRWGVVHRGNQVHVDGLIKEIGAQPVKEAILKVRGLDAQGKVVSSTWNVVYWSDPSGDARTQPFHMRLQLTGTEERFDVVVSHVDYYEWGG